MAQTGPVAACLPFMYKNKNKVFIEFESDELDQSWRRELFKLTTVSGLQGSEVTVSAAAGSIRPQFQFYRLLIF